MAGGTVELSDARDALSAAARRSADLIASIPDHDVRLDRSEWTVADVAAHLAIALRGFTDAVESQESQWLPFIPKTTRYPDRLGGLNRATISAEPRRTPHDAGQAITDAAAAFLEATSASKPTGTIPTPWYGDGVTHTTLSATCLLVGEQLLHGYDVARAVRHAWPITAGDAMIVFEGIRAMMPLAVNAEEAGDLAATYELHIGRQSSFVVRVADGGATVNPPGRPRIDCHIAGTPKALVLVGYGRISQWRAIGTGRLIAWGRKPLLGFRFVNLFFNP
ncbi:MAG: hypothetical protein QOE57_982 [Acidimicrobiaceae bacterium]|nr:hypothetical protein [Acidimicrobiaceae bacterium]